MTQLILDILAVLLKKTSGSSLSGFINGAHKENDGVVGKVLHVDTVCDRPRRVGHGQGRHLQTVLKMGNPRPLLFFIFGFSTFNRQYAQYKFLPITGFSKEGLWYRQPRLCQLSHNSPTFKRLSCCYLNFKQSISISLLMIKFLSLHFKHFQTLQSHVF